MNEVLKKANLISGRLNAILQYKHEIETLEKAVEQSKMSNELLISIKDAVNPVKLPLTVVIETDSNDMLDFATYANSLIQWRTMKINLLTDEIQAFLKTLSNVNDKLGET